MLTRGDCCNYIDPSNYSAFDVKEYYRHSISSFNDTGRNSFTKKVHDNEEPVEFPHFQVEKLESAEFEPSSHKI